MIPSFCANNETASPAAAVKRFITLKSAFLPATAEILSFAAICTPPPATTPIEAGALASKPGCF
ncbi:hypothetical protein WI92_22670, partial [Burkholderia vietnamiensis]